MLYSRTLFATLGFIIACSAYNPRHAVDTEMSLYPRDAIVFGQQVVAWEPLMISDAQQNDTSSDEDSGLADTNQLQMKRNVPHLKLAGSSLLPGERPPASKGGSGQPGPPRQQKLCPSHKVVECGCDKNLGSCLNGKCLCGAADAKITGITNAFAKPIFQGLKAAGEEMQKVFGNLVFGIKTALKLASWAIPGLGKTASKALDAAIPLTGTEDPSVEKIEKIITDVM